MHGHARGIYALVFRRLAAQEDAWKKDKLVLQPRTEWRGNQRDFDEACQSSKVTSVGSHSMGLFINLWPCVCMHLHGGEKRKGGSATLTESWQPPTCQSVLIGVHVQ